MHKDSLVVIRCLQKQRNTGKYHSASEKLLQNLHPKLSAFTI